MEISIDKLPTIPDESMVDAAMRRLQSCAQMTWFIYHAWLIVGLFITIVLTAAIIIAVTQKTVSYPCMQYTSMTLASSVSVECLQYLWNVMCTSHPYVFPLSYDGWWRSSPRGATMVSCASSTVCGVGSYENIRLYMQVCNIRLNQR